MTSSPKPKSHNRHTLEQHQCARHSKVKPLLTQPGGRRTTIHQTHRMNDSIHIAISDMGIIRIGSGFRRIHENHLTRVAQNSARR